MTGVLTGGRLRAVMWAYIEASDIIFVYISLWVLFHYLKLSTLSQLFLDKELSSLVLLFCTATCLNSEGNPIDVQ